MKSDQERDRLLIQNWNTMSRAELARLLGVDQSTVTRHARRLRAIGISLPDKAKTRATFRRDACPDVPADAAPKPIPETATTWPDGWRINPPTRDKLRAGR